MQRVHYTVTNGLQNAQAKTQIKNALDKVTGVQMVNVDFARGTVEVGYSEPADENAVRECIEKTGCKVEPDAVQ
jgi:copper chaperone CopZ